MARLAAGSVPQRSSSSSSSGASNLAASRRRRAQLVFCLALFLAPLLLLGGSCWRSPSHCQPWSASPGAPKNRGSDPITTATTTDPAAQGTLPEDGSAVGSYVDPFASALPESIRKVLKEPWRAAAMQSLPVVLLYQRPGRLPCSPHHYIARVLQQARSLNSVVYFIGPEECSSLAVELDITLVPFSEYRNVVDWFRDNIGYPAPYHVRWYILRAFMERVAVPRVFYMDTDVLLFANMTDLSGKIYNRMPILLPVRWPSLRQVGPSQFPSTLVSGHVALWTHDALCDFLAFHRLFIQEAVLFGEAGNKTLSKLRAYSHMVVLGWYTYRICWIRRPEDLHPQCVADHTSGVTPERSARLRGKFMPRHRVESFAAPRWCANATDYMNRGWGVMDYGFSVQSPRQFFKFKPALGMKLPTSMHYTYFEDWSKDHEQQTSPVQFLSVHFQAHKKGYLVRIDDPAKTWGSNKD